MHTDISASRERVTHFMGKGALIQAVGILAPFGLGALFGTAGAALGIAVLIVLFVAGSAAAVTWRCGHCKNPISSKDVEICPVCAASLD